MKRFGGDKWFAGAVRLSVAPPEPWVPPSKGRAFFSWSVNLLDIRQPPLFSKYASVGA